MTISSDRDTYMQVFADSLTTIMRERGYASPRAKSGVDIAQLAASTGCSYQMARKYLLGQALPEIPVIIGIAKWLQVDPSVLLFGEAAHQAHKKIANSIEINPLLLKYILSKSLPLYAQVKDSNYIIDFIVDTVYDAAHLDVDESTVKKIIDMMMSSATLFNKSKDCVEKNGSL